MDQPKWRTWKLTINKFSGEGLAKYTFKSVEHQQNVEYVNVIELSVLKDYVLHLERAIEMNERYGHSAQHDEWCEEMKKALAKLPKELLE